MASFETKKSGFISFKGSFHGRTSGAVAITDNPKLVAPSNERNDIYILPWNELAPVEEILQTKEIAGIIIEGIQGVGGIQVPDQEFLKGLQVLSKKYQVKLILDEVQSGYGRTGKFFAHQWYAGVEPDIISIAKGMGNGYPIGGVLIHPSIKASHGLLGTTFGGNHLACAAGAAVLEIIKDEDLMSNAQKMGDFLLDQLKSFADITDIRGKGLMIGFDLNKDAGPVRSDLVHKCKTFTGSAAGKQTIRLLPALNIEINDLNSFIRNLKHVIH